MTVADGSELATWIHNALAEYDERNGEDPQSSVVELYNEVLLQIDLKRASPFCRAFVATLSDEIDELDAFYEESELSDE